MLELIPILVATAALLGAVAHSTRPPAARATWEEVAGWLRLDYQPARFGIGEVSGRIEGLPLRVRCFGVGTLGLAGRGTCVVVDLREHLPEHLMVRPLGVRMRLSSRTPWSPPVLTGDSCFDASVAVSGDAQRATALVGDAVRRQLLEFVRRREWVALAEGRLVCMVEDLLDAARLCQLVRRVLDAAHAMNAATRDLPRRLSELAQRDASSRLRRKALEQLVRDFPGHEATAEALAACVHDPDVRIRAIAARALGPLGRDAHVRMLRDCAAPASLRVAALEALATLAGRVELVLHVERALRSAEPALWEAAARVAAAHGLRDSIPTLGRRAVVADDLTAAAIAEALGELCDPLAETWLLHLLGREGRSELAAARALARVGSRRAIPPLLELAHGLFRERALKLAARAAVAEIRSRLGAEPGRVSLIEAPPALRGAVTVAGSP